MVLKRLILACIILIASANITSSHEWYSAGCCSGQDCHPIRCEAISEQGKELIYKGYHFFNDMIKPSQDAQCHVCISNEFHDNPDFTPVPHCIYIQQGS
jgi:hypothetical protein